MKMKLILIAVVVCALAFFMALDYQHGVEVSQETKKVDAITLPSAIVLPSLYKQEALGLDSLRGRYVVLNFWASWCAPCLTEFPELVALAKRYADIAAVVAISVDDSAEDAKQFVAKLKAQDIANMYYVWDDTKEISHNVFQAYRYPETIIIGPDGTMLRKFAGALSENDIAAIERILD